MDKMFLGCTRGSDSDCVVLVDVLEMFVVRAVCRLEPVDSHLAGDLSEAKTRAILREFKRIQVA